MIFMWHVFGDQYNMNKIGIQGNYFPNSVLFRQKVGRGCSPTMEMSDVVVLDVYRKCNGCEAGL
jgi:hypothetical protein